MVSKCIGELNIVEIDTGGSKVDRLIILEEFIRTKERTDPRSLQFEVTDESSAQVPKGKTSKTQSEKDEVNSEKSLINQFMKQIVSMKRLERELAEEKLKSTERVEQASCSCRGNSPQPSTSDISRANQICPDKSQNLPDKTQGNELNMARASILEFAGKKEEDTVRFLLQSEVIHEETGIHVARWVTVLAPQLKAQTGTWWGTMRALDLPWQEFKSELLEKLNGDELQSSLQSELLSTAQTKTETLGEYVLHKYQLYRRLNLGLIEEAVVMRVIGLIRDEFRIHARIQRLKVFSELRALPHVPDGSKAVMSDKAGVSTSVPPNLKWLDKRKIETTEKSQVPNPEQRLSSGA
ncbi:hypothetical protein QTP88_006196 [Uroleucon formosanum]